MNTVRFSVMAIVFALSFIFTACGGDAQADEQGKEYTSAYICPMHCSGSGSDQAGTCPVCKMDYVPNKDTEVAPTPAKAEEDNHGNSHDGHNHDHDHDHDH